MSRGAVVVQDRFGGQHTEQKLQVLEKYLGIYTTALKNQPFRTVYFDAFAGTGEIPVGDQVGGLLPTDDLKTFIRGSARRALSIADPFSEYIFVEQAAQKLDDLKGLVSEFPNLSSRMRFDQGDANQRITEFCKATNWGKTRAVVFLDPFRNQVKWRTVEAIAATKAIDLWYLFPAGLGVYRQIGRDGSVHASHERSLDELLGTSNWRDSFVQSSATNDLFGVAERREKTATPRSITEFMVDRMKGPFRGQVCDKWLPLGSRNIHMYSLIFACANPRGAAWSLANRLATAVMK